MKFYLVKLKFEIIRDYDQHQSFLIVAHDLDDVTRMVTEMLIADQSINEFDFKELNIEDYIAHEIIIEDFNAG